MLAESETCSSSDVYGNFCYEDKTSLSSKVLSGHAELTIANPDGRIIKIWNLSSVVSQQEEAFISAMAKRFVERKVSIQILVGGHETLYQSLKAKIESDKFFQMKVFVISSSTEESCLSQPKTSCIFVDNSKFSIQEIMRFSSSYLDGNQNKKKFSLLNVSVKDCETGLGSTFGAVLLEAGSSANALRKIKRCMNIFSNRGMGFGSFDVVLGGDYGIEPSKVQSAMARSFGDKVAFLQAPHSTCINKTKIVQAVILARKSSYIEFPILQPSSSTKHIVESIDKSVRP